MNGPLGGELRQSITLIFLAAATMAVYVGLGLLAVRFFA